MTEETKQKPSLASILCHKVAETRHTFNLGGRWSGRDITVRPMSTKDMLEYERTAMVRMPGMKEPTLDLKKHMKSILVNHLVDPSPTSKEALAEVGAQTPEEFLFEYFKFDELSRIIKEIREISGDSTAIEDLEDQAKKL